MAATAIDLQPYSSLNDEDCAKRINHARQICGHYYRRDEIFKHADFCGDPLKLSHQGADSQHLAWVLESLIEGNVVNQISVPVDVANDARVALQPMLAIQDKPGYSQ